MYMFLLALDFCQRGSKKLHNNLNLNPDTDMTSNCTHKGLWCIQIHPPTSEILLQLPGGVDGSNTLNSISSPCLHTHMHKHTHAQTYTEFVPVTFTLDWEVNVWAFFTLTLHESWNNTQRWDHLLPELEAWTFCMFWLHQLFEDDLKQSKYSLSIWDSTQRYFFYKE